MPYWGMSRLTARPALAVALRYGLAVASVATALGTTLILRHYGFPPRFISHFTLIAIAITFWCAGTGPGLLALLLSPLGAACWQGAIFFAGSRGLHKKALEVERTVRLLEKTIVAAGQVSM